MAIVNRLLKAGYRGGDPDESLLLSYSIVPSTDQQVLADQTTDGAAAPLLEAALAEYTRWGGFAVSQYLGNAIAFAPSECVRGDHSERRTPTCEMSTPTSTATSMETSSVTSTATSAPSTMPPHLPPPLCPPITSTLTTTGTTTDDVVGFMIDALPPQQPGRRWS